MNGSSPTLGHFYLKFFFSNVVDKSGDVASFLFQVQGKENYFIGQLWKQQTTWGILTGAKTKLLLFLQKKGNYQHALYCLLACVRGLREGSDFPQLPECLHNVSILWIHSISPIFGPLLLSLFSLAMQFNWLYRHNSWWVNWSGVRQSKVY